MIYYPMMILRLELQVEFRQRLMDAWIVDELSTNLNPDAGRTQIAILHCPHHVVGGRQNCVVFWHGGIGGVGIAILYSRNNLHARGLQGHHMLAVGERVGGPSRIFHGKQPGIRHQSPIVSWIVPELNLNFAALLPVMKVGLPPGVPSA